MSIRMQLPRVTALLVGLVTSLATVAGVAQTNAQAAGARSPSAEGSDARECEVPTQTFGGVVGTYVKDSRESWPRPAQAPEGAPNVLIWVIDDAGFGLLSAFGGLVDTPNLDRLAESGLRYTNFHATPLCSPTRAALLTGRNSHAVHVGAHTYTPMGFPGYDAHVPASAATTAQVLRERGYSTIALGKWDHTPSQYISPAGPFGLWPTGQGFDHFYGFMAYESDHFEPPLWSNNEVVQASSASDYFLTTNLANKAIDHINQLKSVDPSRPFYMYWATGAVHAPHQATKPWLERYRGKFDEGWNVYRHKVLERQKKLAIVGPGVELAPRPPELPAWESLSAEQKRLYARQMEAIAAQMSQSDYEFGRIIETLKKNDSFNNTLIIVTADNGASAEGGPDGSFNTVTAGSGIKPGVQENMRHYDAWGGPNTSPHYSAGWAVAANTPFRYFKQSAHEGGTRVPFVMSWPKGIRQPGNRRHYHHVVDISPTILQAAKVTPPACVNGIPQQPLDGIAMNYSFDNPRAPDRRKTQYFEIWGNRAIYRDGWKAVVLHKRRAWDVTSTVPFAEDQWELYSLREDPTERNDLAKSQPAKLKEMQQLFDTEARRFNVYPLDDDLLRGPRSAARIHGGKTVFEYRSLGTSGLSERLMPPISGKSYSITARFSPGPDPQGVIVAVGGKEAGFTLFVKDGRLHYGYNDLDLAHYSIVDPNPLPQGVVEAEVRYILEGPLQGRAMLLVNGKPVGEQRMTQRVINAYSGSGELFNIGSDTGAPVSEAYQAPYPFTGRIDHVLFRLLEPAATASAAAASAPKDQ